jgi:hypothetical protein
MAPNSQGGFTRMAKYVTRKNGHTDRTACAWLIKRFVDPDAEIIWAPADKVFEIAEKEGAIPFDARDAQGNYPELGHIDGRVSFESIIFKYRNIYEDWALRYFAKMVHGADSFENDIAIESPGMRLLGFAMALKYPDQDDKKMELLTPIYDAIYEWCKAAVNLGVRSSWEVGQPHSVKSPLP